MEVDAKRKLLLDFIESKGGEVLEHALTARKVNDRATFIEDPKRPDCVVFEMELHNTAAGASYILTWLAGEPCTRRWLRGM
jgi:hypothetical protein